MQPHSKLSLWFLNACKAQFKVLEAPMEGLRRNIRVIKSDAFHWILIMDPEFFLVQLIAMEKLTKVREPKSMG